jgi:hypothetical protein
MKKERTQRKTGAKRLVQTCGELGHDGEPAIEHPYAAIQAAEYAVLDAEPAHVEIE